MLLLSDATERIRDEIQSWPTKRSNIRVELASERHDVRLGDERILHEVLTVALGLLSLTEDRITVAIEATRDEVAIRFRSGFESIHRVLKGGILGEKVKIWNARLIEAEDGFGIVLDFPAAPTAPPLNIDEMAIETGISPSDAFIIVEGFLQQGRQNMRLLTNETTMESPEHRLRAAHSLKGAGKTLRAPELTAAARSLELAIRENEDGAAEKERLERAWRSIEDWINGEAT